MLDREPILAVPDAMALEQAEAVARRLTRWSDEERPDSETPAGRADPKRSVDLLDLLSLGDVRDFDPQRQWVRREGRDRLRVPFGVTPEGVPVVLDIKETEQYCMGPHGLLIGATGSGKSEVLRTLTLALALTHSPEQLNFVLVDFKGGATFASMAGLPHVSAMISNLGRNCRWSTGCRTLRGEMVRRQELLRQAGLRQRHRLQADRLAETRTPAAPALVIILDEFSELLSAKRSSSTSSSRSDWAGRCRSTCCWLAAAREPVAGLPPLLPDRPARSPRESRTVLGVTDAGCPRSGVGFLKASTESMTRFRASYVAAPPPARRASSALARQAGAPSAPLRVLPFPRPPVGPGCRQAQPLSCPLPCLPARVTRRGRTTRSWTSPWPDEGRGPAHQVWLPPWTSPTPGRPAADLAVDRGWGWSRPPGGRAVCCGSRWGRSTSRSNRDGRP